MEETTVRNPFPSHPWRSIFPVPSLPKPRFGDYRRRTRIELQTARPCTALSCTRHRHSHGASSRSKSTSRHCHTIRRDLCTCPRWKIWLCRPRSTLWRRGDARNRGRRRGRTTEKTPHAYPLLPSTSRRDRSCSPTRTAGYPISQSPRLQSSTSMPQLWMVTSLHTLRCAADPPFEDEQNGVSLLRHPLRCAHPLSTM